MAVTALALLAAACGGEKGTSLTPTSAEIVPVVVSSDVALGPNRFVVGLLDQAQNTDILGAQVHFRFFTLKGNQGTLKFETDAQPRSLVPAPARVATKAYGYVACISSGSGRFWSAIRLTCT